MPVSHFSAFEKFDQLPTFFKKNQFQRFLDYTWDSKEGHTTDCMVILLKGKLAYERCDAPFSSQQKHRVWSISKSFTHALIGLAIQQNYIRLDDTLDATFPMAKSQYKKQITLKHLMQMSSGLDWQEGYEGNPIRSNVVEMLYTKNFKDMGATSLNQRSIAKPGQKFRYSSGETNLVMKWLKAKMPKTTYDHFPWNSLFIPLGIQTATWEKDHEGTFIGSSYLYLSILDLAKFGQFYLQNGRWNNRQILSPSYIKQAMKLAPSFNQTHLEGPSNRESYGMHWWLNVDLPNKGRGLGRPYKKLPSDAYMALGHQGQTLLIIPSMQLVLARSSRDKKKSLDRKKFFDLLGDSFHTEAL